jgi:DNA-binding beta-propeller fold protein YncE
VRERPLVQTQIVVEREPAGDDNAVTAGVIVAVVSVIVTAAVIAYAFHSYYSSSTNTRRAAGPSNTRNNLAPTKTGDGYAQPELSFGSEGIGPGNFTDARSIAVDAEGHVYVGEYSGGRVQVFDSTGKFLTQWTADRRMPLRGMAADRRGNVYVVQSGTISTLRGASRRRSARPSAARPTRASWRRASPATGPETCTRSALSTARSSSSRPKENS